MDEIEENLTGKRPEEIQISFQPFGLESPVGASSLATQIRLAHVSAECQ